MLAEMFDRPTLGDSRYDQIVGSFLNEVAPTDEEGLTRKERLIQTWITLKRTDPPSTSAGKNKIDRVTSQPSHKLALTIDDSEDRSAMLEDLKERRSRFSNVILRLCSYLCLTSEPAHGPRDCAATLGEWRRIENHSVDQRAEATRVLLRPCGGCPALSVWSPA